MGQIRKPAPVKLVIGLLTGRRELFDQVQRLLEERFGPADLVSPLLDFTQTDYYAAEFGPRLVREFLTFERLIDPADLAGIKVWTNGLEDQLAHGERRRINLDPGYISLSKLVLASTKNHSHRIYIGQGIYAEITLRYYKKAFRPWEWTYPDYASDTYRELFQEIRERYMQQLRLSGNQSPE